MKKYKTIEKLEKDIIEYIDYYNNKRIEKTFFIPFIIDFLRYIYLLKQVF